LLIKKLTGGERFVLNASASGLRRGVLRIKIRDGCEEIFSQKMNSRRLGNSGKKRTFSIRSQTPKARCEGLGSIEKRAEMRALKAPLERKLIETEPEKRWSHLLFKIFVKLLI